MKCRYSRMWTSVEGAPCAVCLILILCWVLALTPLALAQAPAGSESPLETAVRAARWQVAQIIDDGQDGQPHYRRTWEQAAFWIGMTALADTTGAPSDIGEAVLAMGRHNQWQPGRLPFFADDHAITQAYLWAARHGANEQVIAPTIATFQRVLDEQPKVSLAFYLPKSGSAECLVRWCWCDALFMAPPALFELARQSGDPRYREHALREWWATTEFLYDPVEKLYYRDSRFFERRDEAERKLFWSRGNGWVFAAMARSLPLLDADSADARRMRTLFQDMAARLVELQKDDGYWPPSLLAAEGSSPETSGTGFFTYGLAWGINAGLLERARYEPAVHKGWAALRRALRADGKLGYVQQISDRPEQVSADDTQYYGVGALLLAASEITRLDDAVER